MTGKVKWFNNRKGYGFITRDDNGEDVFAHYTGIKMDGYRKLDDGATVEFDIAKVNDGDQAVNITVVKASKI